MAALALVVSILALAVSGYAVLKGEQRARRGEHKVVALGVDAQAVRSALEAGRSVLDDVVAAGGQDTSWFENEDRREVERALKDSADRVGDPELRAEIEAVVAAMGEAFGWAPPPQYVVNLNAAPDPRRDKRLGLVAAAAQRGQERCERAFARLNAIEAG